MLADWVFACELEVLIWEIKALLSVLTEWVIVLFFSLPEWVFLR
jgi:hypothetical protein